MQLQKKIKCQKRKEEHREVKPKDVIDVIVGFKEKGSLPGSASVELDVDQNVSKSTHKPQRRSRSLHIQRFMFAASASFTRRSESRSGKETRSRPGCCGDPQPPRPGLPAR